jgi:hypothetical protein
MCDSQLEFMDLFTSNANIAKRGFKHCSAHSCAISALICALEGKVVDCGSIHDAMALIKAKFESSSRISNAFMMNSATFASLAGDSEKSINSAAKVYELLKSGHIASVARLSSAFIIAVNSSENAHERIAVKTIAFSDLLEHDRSFAAQNGIFSAMLGLSDLSVEEGAKRIFQVHKSINAEFKNSSGKWMLAQALALSDDPEGAAANAILLSESFKERKVKIDKAELLAALGVLSLLTAPPSLIATNVMRCLEYIRLKNPFPWRFSKSGALLLAMLAATVDLLEKKKTALMALSIANSIVKSQIAAMACSSSAAAML